MPVERKLGVQRGELDESRSDRVAARALWRSEAYDIYDAYSVLFGGCGSSAIGCSAAALYGDTWEFYGSNWHQDGSCGGPGQSACPASSAPSKRYFALISYPVTKYTFGALDEVDLTGGTTGGVSTTVYSDFWSFITGNWTKATRSPWPYQPLPAPRFDGDLMDKDGSEDYVVMVGGTSPSGSSLGDYEYEPLSPPTAETLWPPVTPSPRASFGLAYDTASSQVVMFGGCGKVCPTNETWVYERCPLLPSPFCSPTFRNQMIWVNVTNDSNPNPPARTNAAMGYDPADDELVLFDGLSATGTVLSDTWVWGGSGWSHGVGCFSVCPAARQMASMSDFDIGSSGGAAVLFGGAGASGNLLNDTWYYSISAKGWNQRSVTAHPSARSSASIAYDWSDGYLLLFGGTTSSGASQQTWELSGTTISGIVWTQLSPSKSPPAEAGGGMTYDGNDGNVLLFENGDQGTWSYVGGAWTQATSPTACLPSCTSPLGPTPIAFSDQADYVVLFGGWGANGSVQGQTFGYENGVWVPYAIENPSPSESSPPAMFGAAMAFDAAIGRVVLVGGCAIMPLCSDTMFGMWTFQSGYWSFESTGTMAIDAPNRVAFASMVYEPIGGTGALLLFGGFETGAWLLSSSTWMLQGMTWTKLSVTGPSARWGASMAFDGGDGYVVLYGGCGAVPTPGSGFASCSSLLSDTWKFTGTGPWSSISGAGPTARFEAAMASNPTSGPVFLVGGWNAGPLGDEWEFSGGGWSKLVNSLPFAPRWAASMTFDEQMGLLTITGGFGVQSGSTVALNDTWVQPSTGHWSSVGRSGWLLPARGYGSRVFDPYAGGDGWSLQFGGTNALEWGSFGGAHYYTNATGWVDISFWT